MVVLTRHVHSIDSRGSSDQGLLALFTKNCVEVVLKKASQRGSAKEVI